MSAVAMQSRCVYCGREQYAPAVLDISRGQHPCVWCGKTPPMMTEQEYRTAMSLLFAKKAMEHTHDH